MHKLQNIKIKLPTSIFWPRVATQMAIVCFKICLIRKYWATSMYWSSCWLDFKRLFVLIYQLMSKLTLAEKMKTSNLKNYSQHEDQYLSLRPWLVREYSTSFRRFNSYPFGGRSPQPWWTFRVLYGNSNYPYFTS